MSIVPSKYHTFISPPLRRVFLGDGRDSSRATINNLSAEVATLKARVVSLKRDKALLMDRCEAAQSALADLNEDELAASVARDKAEEEALVANQNLERLRAEYHALKSR